jgi:hypothetical protein
MRELIDSVDKRISVLGEELARRLNRRQVLEHGVKGLAAAVGAMTIGSLSGIKEAFAITCNCNWIQGKHCTNCPPANPYCGSGCSICTSTDWCSGWCIYSGGQWISCTGFGPCGNGYKVCTDCKCNSCSNMCTCLSAILCNGCCSPAEVQADAHVNRVLVQVQ